MGIPAYFSYLVKNHPEIIKKLHVTKGNVCNLLLDCNSIIYDSLVHIEFTDKSNYESSIIQFVCDKIQQYINEITPSNLIYIAFDGVAPVAKLDQQRSRRYKSWFTNKILNKTSNWDRCAITPGTDFMQKLSQRIHETFNKNPLCKISTSTEPGEGEHKLFQHIRDNPSQYVNKKTVVYGLDADLIMLCINHIYLCGEIYLYRETPEFIKSLNSSLNPSQTYLLDINCLANEISYSMNNNKVCNTDQEKNKLFDYIFICFLLGNDFMPHFPHINIRSTGMSILMDAYKQSIGNQSLNLTNGKEIYWNNFRKFISYLAERETGLFQEEYDRRLSLENKHTLHDKLEDKLNNIPIKDLSEERFVNPHNKYWEFRYYKTLFDLEGTTEDKSHICRNYLEALEWNFKYYTDSCYDWEWKYNYSYPPLLSDLLKYIPSLPIQFITRRDTQAISHYTQLAYVLPKSSLHLLPSKIRKTLLLNDELYTEDGAFRWNYCRYFWESHAHLPYIPISKLESIVASV